MKQLAFGDGFNRTHNDGDFGCGWLMTLGLPQHTHIYIKIDISIYIYIHICLVCMFEAANLEVRFEFFKWIFLTIVLGANYPNLWG